MMTSRNQKIVLGTVQFGLNYGINNQTGQVSPAEVDAILQYASTSGIQYLDTSSAYGESESAIGRSLRSNPHDFRIVTKYPQGNPPVKVAFKESLNRMGVGSAYGYLVHHFDFYLTHPEIWDEIQLLKDAGLITKAGFSIYSPEQLEIILSRGLNIELIQFPLNILDRQFEPYLQLLKQNKIEVHTRSVFLQGLFFRDPDAIHGTLAPLRPTIETIRTYCSQRKRSIESLALNYVAALEEVDGILIGVDSSEQLRKNMEALSGDFDTFDMDFIQSLQVTDKALLNPVNWK